jgi:hypothetical protein
MAATLTSMNAALRRIYTPDALVEQLYQDNPFLDMLEKGSKYKLGELARVVIHNQRNWGGTFLPDGGGTLNTAGQQGINKAEYNYKHQHQQIAIQEDVLESTASNAEAVAEVLDVETTGAVNDLRKQLTRCLFGNGDALLSGTRTGGAATEIELDAEDGYNAINRGWLAIGAVVDVGTTANEVSLIDGEAVTAVEESATTPSITVTTSVSTTAGTHFVSLKNSRSGTTSYEPNGLRNIVSTSAALGGLAATIPTWKASSVDTTAQALTISLILQQDQAIKQKDGGTVDFYLTGLKQERKLYEQLQQQVRFPSDASIAAGKVEAPTWNGKAVMAHNDCPDEDFYSGVRKHLFIVASDKPFWQNKHTGGKILEWVQGTSSYGAKLAYHFNLATDRRNSFGRLGGLT